MWKGNNPSCGTFSPQLLYLATFTVDFYGKLVGQYTGSYGWRTVFLWKQPAEVLVMVQKSRTTTWDVKTPVNNRMNYLSSGAGILPSTL